MSHVRPCEPRTEPQRVEAFVRDYYAFTWRVLRRYGLVPADADDAAQKVFLIAVDRLADIQPGSERAFLFRTARHVASKAHRSVQRRRDAAALGVDAAEAAGNLPAPDDLLDRRRARDLLDRILEELSEDFRAVFVLFEIEGMPAPEIAEALSLPVGTVASRLRRARAEVERRATRYLAHPRIKGSMP
ncbi:MAG TPA: RNA polymerase sigma factor [Polyangiaceae bacterium]|nr:RNA polymerase sigma factor [Polyangiaceae bacterium]